MKIRNSFVANSSSTSFTFVFFKPKDYTQSNNNPMKELFALIMKYRKHFNLKGYSGSINAQDVAETLIEDLLSSTGKNDYDSSEIVTISEAIERKKEDVERYKRLCKESKWDRKSYLEYYQNQLKMKQKLEKAKENGLEIVAQAYFGDHDGPWAGTIIGDIMDYEGRYIDINEDDFVVFTEQAR